MCDHCHGDNHQHDHSHDHSHAHAHDHPHPQPQPHHAAPQPVSRGLKIAVTGKGGVGKTTLASLLSRAFADAGSRVLAVDADPDANLAAALGIPAEKSLGLLPIARMKDLAEERTGASGGYGSLFKLNPTVKDLPDKFCLEHDGIRFLWMGTVEQAGGGCACPESVLVKRLMGHLLLDEDEVVILDMEAGIEHLGRRTAESVDALVVVVEPGQRSIQTAYQVMQLAGELGIGQIFVVGSKVRDDRDRLFIESAIPQEQFLGYLSYSEELQRADRENAAPDREAPAALREAVLVKDRLLGCLAARRSPLAA
jgi:CO dehydrogenase maturation factor